MIQVIRRGLENIFPRSVKLEEFSMQDYLAFLKGEKVSEINLNFSLEKYKSFLEEKLEERTVKNYLDKTKLFGLDIIFSDRNIRESGKTYPVITSISMLPEDNLNDITLKLGISTNTYIDDFFAIRLLLAESNIHKNSIRSLVSRNSEIQRVRYIELPFSNNLVYQ